MDDGTVDAFKFIWLYTFMPLFGAFVALGIHELIAIRGNNHIQYLIDKDKEDSIDHHESEINHKKHKEPVEEEKRELSSS